MKIVIGIIVVLGLGWLLLGTGGEDVTTPETDATEEVATEEGAEVMDDDVDSSDDAMAEEGDDAMVDGETPSEGDDAVEEEAAL